MYKAGTCTNGSTDLNQIPGFVAMATEFCYSHTLMYLLHILDRATFALSKLVSSYTTP